MSANIEIWKVFEDDHIATYAFGDMGVFVSKAKGKVVILKKTGVIYLVEKIDKTLSQKHFDEAFRPKIIQALTEFRLRGVYSAQKNLPDSGLDAPSADESAILKDTSQWRSAASAGTVKSKLDKILISFFAFSPDGLVKLSGSGFIVVAASRKAIVMTTCHQFYLHKLVPHPKPTYPSTAIHELNVHTGELFDVDNEKIKAVYHADNLALPCVIQGVSMVPELNIALCAVELPPDYTGPGFSFQIGLDSKIPKIGDEVAAIGFSGTANEWQALNANADGLYAQMVQNLEMRIGRVTGVFANGSSRAAWPCFETTIPMQNGMQGGPVFPFSLSNMSMNVCAVISSDMSPAQAFNDHSIPGRSIMAMIWPALILPFSAEDKTDARVLENNLLGLIRKGRVKDEGNADKRMTAARKGPDAISISIRHQ
ncbi:MAG: serine protease [Desulfobacterales bacterium]|jgi:hypothetical protein|nr:serine protease [Desulfobacterales bacterium]